MVVEVPDCLSLYGVYMCVLILAIKRYLYLPQAIFKTPVHGIYMYKAIIKVHGFKKPFMA